jgi:alkanesulfonate monooxygenase SsuD/methylene tetrahydromethanopterin reductase-like flavin-dependent oxidoreductase (luciferase family)
VELGLITLTELSPDPVTGAVISAGQRLREIVEAARLADEAGLGVFAVGEHHRSDYAVSSPPVVLAAIAQATDRIRVTSGTTLLSTADPVRVYQDFATVDLLSGGRGEIIVGRGASTESFGLFGYSLDDYDALFAEHLELLMQVNEHERVTWQGQYRPALNDAEITPRAHQERLPIWVGVGGNPASAVRAGGFGLPMTLALIGGSPAAAAPVVGLYRQARETFFPYYRHYLAEQLDGARDDREGQAAKIDLGKDALVAEEPVLPQSLVDDLLRAADVQSALR